MKFLNINNQKLIFEENTGKWLVLNDEGFNIFINNFKNKEIKDKEIKDFIFQVKEHLNNVQLINKKEKGLTVLLTNQCNLECLHCYYGSSICKPEMLKFNDEYCSFIKQYVEDGLKWICFTGGEPLLNPQFIEFVRHAISLGLNVSVLTNGMLVNEELVNLFKENNVFVQVSLDGTKAVYEKIRKKSSFERVCDNIGKLTQAGVQTDISFVPSRINISDFQNVAELAMDLNINLLHMPFLEKYGRAEDNYEMLALSDDELIKFLDSIIENYFSGKYGKLKIGFIENIKNQLLFPHVKECCKACNELVLGIDYTNTVYPCSELIMDEYKIGKTADSLSTIRKNFREKIHSLKNVTVNRVEKCKDCVFKMLCGGGCRVQALLSGGLYSEDKNCAVIKFLYEKLLTKIIELDLEE